MPEMAAELPSGNTPSSSSWSNLFFSSSPSFLKANWRQRSASWPVIVI